MNTGHRLARSHVALAASSSIERVGRRQAACAKPLQAARSISALGATFLVCTCPVAAAEVWRAGSVLTITETVEVRDSLVIEAGVTAYFSELASIDVLAGGTLTIEGTAESPVRLLPLDVEFSWFGITFLPGSDGTLRHMELTGANSVSLSIFESSPLVEFCRIGDTEANQFSGSPLRAGIRVEGEGALPIIRRCVIESIRGRSAPQGSAGANGLNGPNGANGTFPGSVEGEPGSSGTNGSNGAVGLATPGSAIGIWVTNGAGATIESNVIRWIQAGEGAPGGNGGKGGDGGDGGDAFDGSLIQAMGSGGGEGGNGGNGAAGHVGGSAHGIFVDKAGDELIIAGNAIYAIAGGRGGKGGNGGAGGDGGVGGDGSSCFFCPNPGDGASGGGAGSGGAGGPGGPGGTTRAITIQLPPSSTVVHVVNNSVALIIPPEPALGGTAGPAGTAGAGGLGGVGGFGSVGLDGPDGPPGTPGTSGGAGSPTLAYGVSAAGPGLIVETRNHVSDLNPAGIGTTGSGAFRAEAFAQMLVTNSVFTGHTIAAIGVVELEPTAFEADPLFIAPPLSIPTASDCCSWVGGQTGCSNIPCETLVCGEDPTCCGSAWDGACADLAWSLCPNLCQPFASTDLRVAARSLAIDLGDNSVVPVVLTSDLDFAPRIADGDGNGTATVDAGAYELPAVLCGADVTCDGAVDGADLATMLGAWGACPSPCSADLDGSGSVDGADLAILLGAWG